MSPIAGRLVSRLGRRITVIAIGVMMSGAGGAVRWPCRTRPRSSRGPWLAFPLLLAGLGGGAVISPNQTLSLNDVPPRMGGAAGAALQTGQRIGSALGAAVLVTAYQLVLARSDNAALAAEIALGCSLVILTGALLVAIWDVRRG